MPLFDIIKDPNSAESAVAVLVQQQEELSAEQEPQENSELQALRAAAMEADAREAFEPEYPMDGLAHSFLAKCLAQAQQSSVRPYRHDPDVEDGFRSALRIVGVVVLTGDWPTVLNARESALATVAELQRRGFETPRHDYRRIAGAWQLRIRFSF